VPNRSICWFVSPSELDNIIFRLLPDTSSIHSIYKVPGASRARPVVEKQHPITHRQTGRDLGFLLETERHTGLTHERDPDAQRTDYKYFGKKSFWVLIEDLEGTHAPIAVKDYGRYPNSKPRLHKAKKSSSRSQKGLFDDEPDNNVLDDEVEQAEAPPWPPLRDEKGKAKSDWAENRVHGPQLEVDPGSGSEVEVSNQTEEEDGGEVRIHDRDGEIQLSTEEINPSPAPYPIHALRRTASMHDIGHVIDPAVAHPTAIHPTNHKTRHPHPPQTILRGADSEYIVASGNSVSITSHINSTTSYANGHLLDMGLGPYSGHGVGFNHPHNPVFAGPGGGRQLEKRLHHQVLTRGAAGAGGSNVTTAAASSTARKSSFSGVRSRTMLRKAKSTNALRRDHKGIMARSHQEVKKPGYCENCRIKFEDFEKVCDTLNVTLVGYL
jgi:regulatory subunit for Cdc7p protein kinase